MDAAVLPNLRRQYRLQLHALAYNLGNFMRTLAMPKAAEPWSLTSLREKLIKIGAKVVSHGCYVGLPLCPHHTPPKSGAGTIERILISPRLPMKIGVGN
jgi:hypothetical protein